MDYINVNGMEFFGYHGVLSEENRLGQRFIIDVEMGLDLQEAGRSDDLEQTVNYAVIYEKIKEIVEGKPFKLIEALAEAVAGAVLAEPLIKSVKVTVHKPAAPVAGIFRDINITIQREKAVSEKDGSSLPVEYVKPNEPYNVYLSLGSNMGDRVALLKEAIRKLSVLTGVLRVRVSSFYETPPWGKTDQAAFINCAVELKCEYPLMELLHYCKFIELDLGRERHEHWGPRTVDIDILCVDDGGADFVVDNAELIVPHRYMLERSFVLVPLAELAPDFKIKGESIAAYRDKLADRFDVKKIAIDE